MIGIDYDSFIIVSCIGAHSFKTQYIQRVANWDSVCGFNTRSKEMNEHHYSSKKLTIFAVSKYYGVT